MTLFKDIRKSLDRTVAPTVEPVSVGELKDHARWDSDDLTSKMQGHLISARSSFEKATQRALTIQTWALTLDCFPEDEIELRRCPVQSVTSITYLDGNGVSQTLSTSVYTTVVRSEPARIALRYGQSWPTTYPQAGAVTVTFVAGYGTDGTSVPEEAKEAIWCRALDQFDGTRIYEDSFQAYVREMKWAGYPD